MTVKELKGRVKPGTQLRLVHGWRKNGPCDMMRVVHSTNTVGWTMLGEGTKTDKGDPIHMDWPKAKELKGITGGFRVECEGGPRLDYLWVEGQPPTAKDLVVDFLLNRLDKMIDDDDGAIVLGDAIGHPDIASEIIKSWRALKPEVYRAYNTPVPCDRGIRMWLDLYYNWANISILPSREEVEAARAE